MIELVRLWTWFINLFTKDYHYRVDIESDGFLYRKKDSVYSYTKPFVKVSKDYEGSRKTNFAITKTFKHTEGSFVCNIEVWDHCDINIVKIL